MKKTDKIKIKKCFWIDILYGVKNFEYRKSLKKGRYDVVDADTNEPLGYMYLSLVCSTNDLSATLNTKSLVEAKKEYDSSPLLRDFLDNYSKDSVIYIHEITEKGEY